MFSGVSTICGCTMVTLCVEKRNGLIAVKFCKFQKIRFHLKVIMKIKENMHTDITYSSIDAVNALALYTRALHQWKFVEVNFWFFWRRPIL